MEPYRNERGGLYRPRVPSRISAKRSGRGVQRDLRALPSHRDPGAGRLLRVHRARASELLSATLAGLDPGRQLITVVRKGTRELQQLPASTDAFVWLRLYQVEMEGADSQGASAAVVVGARRPARPLTYHAVHRMFERVSDRAGGDGDVALTPAYGGLPDG